MANYYMIQHRAFKLIEKRIKAAGKTGIDKNMLLYELTSELPIGAFVIKKRIDLMLKLEIIGNDVGFLKWMKK